MQPWSSRHPPRGDRSAMRSSLTLAFCLLAMSHAASPDAPTSAPRRVGPFADLGRFHPLKLLRLGEGASEEPAEEPDARTLERRAGSEIMALVLACACTPRLANALQIPVLLTARVLSIAAGPLGLGLHAQVKATAALWPPPTLTLSPHPTTPASIAPRPPPFTARQSPPPSRSRRPSSLLYASRGRATGPALPEARERRRRHPASASLGSSPRRSSACPGRPCTWPRAAVGTRTHLRTRGPAHACRVADARILLYFPVPSCILLYS
eukprot:scaffold3195_cov100-Isochrysis_galbana.AAC.6